MLKSSLIFLLDIFFKKVFLSLKNFLNFHKEFFKEHIKFCLKIQLMYNRKSQEIYNSNKTSILKKMIVVDCNSQFLLQYFYLLPHTGKQLPDFIPLLIPEGEKEWVWTGPDYMEDDVIVPLFNHWLETLNSILVIIIN